MGMSRRLLPAIGLGGLVLAASVAFAQQIWTGGGYGRGRMAPKWATTCSITSAVKCRPMPLATSH